MQLLQRKQNKSERAFFQLCEKYDENLYRKTTQVSLANKKQISFRWFRQLGKLLKLNFCYSIIKMKIPKMFCLLFTHPSLIKYRLVWMGLNKNTKFASKKREHLSVFDVVSVVSTSGVLSVRGGRSWRENWRKSLSASGLNRTWRQD
jgi:hypothetical protein